MKQKDIKRASEISKHLQSFGSIAVKVAPKPRTPIPNRTQAPAQPMRAFLVEAPAPSTTDLSAIIEPLVKHHVALTPPPEMDITQELVKKIIQVMHTLPEMDKLEVSKGIRNASSFIYKGTKYDTSELMHGGSSGGSSSINFKTNEVVSGSGTSWTLANPPTTGTVSLYANGQRLIPTVDYTISGSNITTTSSWVTGTILADYQF